MNWDTALGGLGRTHRSSDDHHHFSGEKRGVERGELGQSGWIDHHHFSGEKFKGVERGWIGTQGVDWDRRACRAMIIIIFLKRNVTFRQQGWIGTDRVD